jgi:hypothetical protein
MDEINSLIGALQTQQMDTIDSTLSMLNVLNMLNTKYIIINPNSAPLINNHAKGNAWFIRSLVFANNADEELAAVGLIDLDEYAVMDVKYADKLYLGHFIDNEGDTIELTEYAPNRMTYRSKTGADRLAVFSEIFYDKGWSATIDGEPVEHIVRLNYLLRGVLIPPGEHTIVFEFKPDTYYTGEKISYAGSILLLLLLAGAIYMEIKKKKEDQ